MQKHNTAPPFFSLAENGYLSCLVPIVPPNAEVLANSSLAKMKLGKVPGQYLPLSKKWTGLSWRKTTATLENLKEWEKWPKVGIGIKTGTLIAIDIDVLDDKIASWIECEFLMEIGLAPCRIGRAPKRLLLYRIDGEPRGKITLQFSGSISGKIEILGEGNQFVAYGLHPDTGRPYIWSKDNPENIALADLVEASYSQIIPLLKKIETGLQKRGLTASLTGENNKKVEKVEISSDLLDQPYTIDLAINYLKGSAPMAIEFEGGNNTTFVVACELLNMGISEDKALELMWEHWNEFKAEPSWEYEELETIARNAAKYNNSGIGSKHPSACFSKRIDSQNPHDFRRKLTPIAWDYLEGLPPRDYLIKGFLDDAGMSVLYGESNCGKTFVAIDIAAHIALGMEWRGKKTKQGAVFMLVTICDYNDIQKLNTRTDTLFDTRSHTVLDTDADTNKTNETNLTNKPNNTYPNPDFLGIDDAPNYDPLWKWELRYEVGDVPYDAWIKPLAFENGYIICPSKVSENWCREKYSHLINRALLNESKNLIGFKTATPK